MAVAKSTKLATTGPRNRARGKLVSIVVPVFNEQACIERFVTEIESTFAGLEGYRPEILFVNDGSSDGTEFVIRSLMTSRPHVRLANLSRNFGKEAALKAGLDLAEGAAVIPMDVDLQDPPALLPQMIEHWARGAKVVNARRENRASDSWLKRTTAGGFYRVFNAVAERRIPHNVGDFRLLDRQVVEVLRGLGEKSRFNKELFSWVGFETREVTFVRPQRHAGHSAWGYWRLWSLALDGLFGASTLPLRVWSYTGMALALISLCYAAFILARTLIFGADFPGYASTVILISSLGGLNLFAIGMIGEYVGRIYTEVRPRPLYILRSTHGESA